MRVGGGGSVLEEVDGSLMKGRSLLTWNTFVERCQCVGRASS